MQISSIGAAGIGASPCCPSVGGLPTTGSAGTPGTCSPMLPGRIGGLAETLGEFNSAEILMALMMMAAADQDEKRTGGGAAMLGLLAGLALSASVGQQVRPECQLGMPACAELGADTVGLQLNAQA